jgi:hypothetical protein
MGTITKKKVKIYIADAGTDVSSLTSANMIKGEIREYDLGDGDQEFETENVFGGQIDIVNPRGQFSLEFTIRPQTEYAERWEAMAFGKKTVGGVDVYSPAIDSAAKLIVIETVDSTDNAIWAFNNARNVSFNFSHNADESREGTLSFSISPEDSEGTINIGYAETSIALFPDWDELGDSS